MPTSAFNPPDDARLESAGEVTESQAFVAHYESTPALGTTTAVHAAVTDDGTVQTITTGITDPTPCRVLTATSGGTAADIKAIQVTVTGTDIEGAALSEALPVFTENTSTTVTGSKAFNSVTSISIPAHDGTAATTAIGVGDKLGLHHKLARNTVISTFLADTIEGTAATVTTSATVVSSNTIDLNSALDGTDVDSYYLVSGGE